MVDYIIVGLGLAGIAFCEELEDNGHSFLVFDDGNNISSSVAAGLYNPVILKRLTLARDADNQMEIAIPFYKKLENKLGIQILYPVPVWRRLNSIEEQNLWFEATDNRILEKYLHTPLHQNNNLSVNAPLGFGEVCYTGRIDTPLLLQTYRNYLKNKNKLLPEKFDYEKLQTGIVNRYKDISSKYIVFAEGFGLKKNPYFNYLPLDGTKGELLTIYAPDLKLDNIINASVFVIPLENDHYKVGATYHWYDKTVDITTEAKEELIEGLEKLINCPYEIVSHEAGIRPSTVDRKPLAGAHPVYENLFVMNGLGTRGVLIGPQLASNLYRHIEKEEPLDKDVDIKRIKKKSFF